MPHARISLRFAIWLPILGMLALFAPPGVASALPAPLDLRAEEAAGGHTIQRHVEKSEAALRARLARETSIPAASSFTDIATAEREIAAALHHRSAAIDVWAQASGGSPVHAFTYNANRVVGHGVVRATGKLQEMTKVQIVLRKTSFGGRKAFLLTAYPAL